MSTFASFLAVCLFSLVHLFIGRLRIQHSGQRSVFLSGAAGVAVAYVFVRVLPKLAQKQQVFLQATDPGLYGFLEHHAYLIALTGFVLYYALDRAVVFLEDRSSIHGVSELPSRIVPSLQVVGFAAYSLLIGYLAADISGPGLTPLLLFTTAMFLHFLGNDYGLHHKYGVVYERTIRWVLVVSTFAGWGIGVATRVSDTTEALWTSFLSGGIIINAIKDELPTQQHARFWPFLVGATAYALRWLAIEAFTKVTWSQLEYRDAALVG